MAVIIREEREVNGKRKTVKIYKEEGLITKKVREEAEELDANLDKKMNEIEMEVEGLLRLKNHKGVVGLWYEVGKRLSFIDKLNLSSHDKMWIWRALYDHGGNLVPGAPKVRANERPTQSHFAYCYRLGKFTKKVALSADWTGWVEFFDSTAVKNDNRIINWLAQKSATKKGARQDWLRTLTKEIRREFKQKDTRIFTEKELYEILERIFTKMQD